MLSWYVLVLFPKSRYRYVLHFPLNDFYTKGSRRFTSTTGEKSGLACENIAYKMYNCVLKQMDSFFITWGAKVTIDKANELIAMHVQMGSFYNRNAVKMILGEVNRDHGQGAVDRLIRDHKLEELWQFKQGTVFKSDFAK